VSSYRSTEETEVKRQLIFTTTLILKELKEAYLACIPQLGL
jgi:hypothetical protein